MALSSTGQENSTVDKKAIPRSARHSYCARAPPHTHTRHITSPSFCRARRACAYTRKQKKRGSSACAIVVRARRVFVHDNSRKREKKRKATPTLSYVGSLPPHRKKK